MKNDPIELELASLDAIPLHTPEGNKQLAKALASRSNLVVAKAARIAGEAQVRELTADLVRGFERFLKGAATLDKGCVATAAMARALFRLEHDDSGLFLKGMQHVQMEPVWGGSIDTATELRTICAMGLASTSYPDKLRELVHLLVDREWQARAGAARAIAVVGSEAAALLLRLKVLLGDKEPEVLADCFSGLLSIENAGAVKLVTSFAVAGNEEVRDAAILALGASRRADAVAWLIERFEAVADTGIKRSILLALATSRTETAIAFVLQVIREGNDHTSAMAVAAMELNRRDTRLGGQVAAALQARGG